MSTTALTRITRAFKLLNVFQAGATIPPDDAQDAFDILNDMIRGWTLDALLTPVQSREVFPLQAGKGSPANPYTIGAGGNLNTARPPMAGSLTGVGLQLNASVPPVEIPRAVYNDAAYTAIAIKALTSTLFTGAYYDPTYAGGLGSLYLWPVPTDLTNSLVLYRRQPLTAFVSLTAVYDLPEGTEEAIDYNLARRLKGPYGRTMSADDLLFAEGSLSRLRHANVDITDLACDPVYLGRVGAGYNIETDQ